MDRLDQYIESIIFVADQPVNVRDIKYALDEVFGEPVPEDTYRSAIARLKEKYRDDQFAFQIMEIAGGLQFMTKPAFHSAIAAYLKQITNKKLSRVALETLAIVAYKQPVTKSEVERIRGVNCDYAIQKLLEKELVEILGRGEGPGRPLLYGTSYKFMDYFGLKEISDLPKLKEFKTQDNTIGEPAPIEENPDSEA